MSRTALFALAAATALTACSGSTGSSAAQSAEAQVQGTPAPVPAGLPFTLTRITQFKNPFGLAFLPDGRALVTEKDGKLKLWRPSGGALDVAGVPGVATPEQGGLLDVAIAPDFATSNIVYLTYSEPRPEGSSLAMARAKLVTTGTPRLDGLEVIFRAGSDGKGGQFGAVIAFSPDGQSLFLSSGERQRFTPAQDPNQTLGKILHLTLDGKPWPGNPGAGKVGSPTVQVFDPPKNSEIAKTTPARTQTVQGPNLAPAMTWSSGHRNPYGLAFDASGNLWEIEMGPRGGDEVNLILPGKNYGWPNVSNGDNYDGVPIPDHKPGDGYEAPKVFWNPSISPAGLIVYSGNVFPQWKGSAFLGAMSGTALIRVKLDGTNASKADQWDLGMRIRDVAQSPDGGIWLLEDGDGNAGWLMRVDPKKN